MLSSERARLHVFALSSFAIAQPLYDVMGRHAEFLVAHRAGPWTIAALVAVLSLIIPLGLVVLLDALRLVSARLSVWLWTATIGCLMALVTAGAAKEMRPAIALTVAALAGTALPVAYRMPAIRSFLTMVSPAVVIFPIVFVGATPVSRLVWPQPVQQPSASVQRRPPIIIVVFDELGTFTLLDANGAIDDSRFPNFAALARTSSWFPDAVATFPYTERALPGILTGISPDGSSTLLPIAADHPASLFTLLAGSYVLHVAEPITALCPAALCGVSTAAAGVRPLDLISDLAVLYLHLVVPRDLAAARLPSLAVGWKGFGATSAPDEAPAPAAHEWNIEAAFVRAAEPGRAELFRRFVHEIEPGPEPVLHFVHALLPHDPYGYLPSGRTYPHGGVTAGLSSDGIWTGQRALVETGRRRHDAQAQLVDTLLGELMARLRSQGLFDAALLIVTSDHGGAFEPGEPHRVITATNYRELVAVPMFVKLPYQQTASISDRRASGLDIVPTIAEAIGAKLPWPVDGRPMFAATFPPRVTLEYAGLPLPPLRAPAVREEARQAESGTSAIARNSVLVGKRLTDLDVRPDAPGMEIFSDNFRSFQSVSLDSGFLPALVDGRIEFDAARSNPVQLALAVNGIVRAVTQTAAWYGSPHYFAALVPESAFQTGANRLEVLAVDAASPQLRLARISSELAEGLSIRGQASGEHLVTSGGRQIPIQPHIIGFVDRIDEHPDNLTFNGWALDRRSQRPLRAVVAFTGNVASAFATPRGRRPDVAAALTVPASLDVSYGIDVSREDLKRGAVRLFGISADLVAGGLRLSPQAQQVLGSVGTPPNR